MTKTPPTNRLDQTINDLNFALAINGPPILRWRNLLVMAKHGKPMTACELEFATNTIRQGCNLIGMERLGLVDSTKTSDNKTKRYRLTPEGEREAAKVIQGRCNDLPFESIQQPDMSKVHQYIGTPGKSIQ